MQKRFTIKNKVLILLLLMFIGILPSLFIKVNSFIHQRNYLEISNLEDAIYNDCKMTSKGIEIYGPDPYLVLGGFDIYLNSIELVWNNQNDLKNVQLFYDEGTGFCEQNSIIASNLSSGDNIKINTHQQIKTIRVDFDAASDYNIIDLQAVRLNAHWTMQFSDKILVGGALIIVLTLLLSWAILKFKYVSGNELLAFAIVEVGVLIICYGLMWIHGLKYIILYGGIVICLTVFLSQLISYKNEKKVFLTFLLFVFFTLLFWICSIPYNGAPDEAMRYDIVNYIVQYGKIPLGEEIEIRNETYGFSYAFTPINIYILDAFVVKIASLFTTNFNTLIMIARIPNVLLAIGTIAFSYGIACEKLFGRAKWIFLSGVILLPEIIFIFSYINCDGIAVFSFAWIVYYMIKAEKTKWALKECLMLGLGIGICLLSYYNAYGVVLTTVIYCVVSVLKDATIDNKISFLLQRTIWVFIPAFLYAGWWFIRGAYYHNGDFLGLASSREYGELYGVEGYKPSQRITPHNMNVSLRYMLHDMEWLKYSAMSYIAVFGWMNIYMPNVYYQVYYGSIIVAIVIAFVHFCNKHIQEKNSSGSSELEVSGFNLYLIANMIISFAIAIYYSYFNDFQAQGRYFILAAFPIMYFVAKCLEFDMEKQSFRMRNTNIKAFVQLLFSIFFVVMFEFAFVFGIIPCYF